MKVLNKMRKITEQSTAALYRLANFTQGNTSVMVSDDKSIAKMYLHGNCIATYRPVEKRLSITNAGWLSNVTKERLNGLLRGVSIRQIKGKWYLISTSIKVVNGEWVTNEVKTEWNGEWYGLDV